MPAMVRESSQPSWPAKSGYRAARKTLTDCLALAGSLDHEKEDAESLAEWEVDYFKYDNCFNLGRMGTAQLSFNRYKTMWDAINATGRPMVYSLCSWGEDYVHTVWL